MNISDLMKYFPCVPYVPPSRAAIRAFEALWQSTLKNGASSVIDYRSPYPKHEFLNYLVEQKKFLLHGSNHDKIKVLLPMRLTKDAANHGNLEAVYACSDGVWPIYYAIAHRNCPKVSFKTACVRIQESDRITRKYYYFSLHEEMHRTQPWTEGMIYILPRTTFRQLRNDADQLIEEWASDEPVVAVAKLPVSAQDFPFLDYVLAHRDEAPLPPSGRFAISSDRYIGRYTFSDDLSIDVTKAGNFLFVEFPGYPPAPLTPISPSSFRLRPLDIQVAFRNNEHGKPSHLALSLNGQDWVAQKSL